RKEKRQFGKQSSTMTTFATLGNPTAGFVLRPRGLFVARQSARKPSADKKSDRLRQCIRATACKRFRRRLDASRRSLLPFAAKSEAPSRFPAQSMPPPGHEIDSWLQLF